MVGVTMGYAVRPAWLIEARGLANRSEGLGWPGRAGPGPVDNSEWSGPGPGPVDKSEGLGLGWPANTSEGFWGYRPRAGRPTLFGKTSDVNKGNLTDIILVPTCGNITMFKSQIGGLALNRRKWPVAFLFFFSSA